MDALVSFPRPSSRKQLQSYLDLAGYYRRFLPNFSDIMSVLTDLLQKKSKFEWNEMTESAFLDLKSRLASRPILRPASYDIPFCVPLTRRIEPWVLFFFRWSTRSNTRFVISVAN